MLLSIIIPCYNSSKFIASTLDMLINQNLSNCEVIIVNDGSTDNTSEIIHTYSEIYSCIKIVDKENEGVSIARNIGLEIASGEYIYFLDSDDTIADGTLDFYRKILTTYRNLDIYCFGYISIQNGKLLKEYISSKFTDCTLDKDSLTESFFTKKIPVNICSSIFNRAFINMNLIRFTAGLKIGEDIEFILKIILKSESLYYNARVCFNYQIRNDSAMQGYKVYHPVKTWIRNKLIIDDFGDKKYELFYNYWIKNTYILKLYLYFRYGVKDKDTEDAFLRTKYFLKLPTITFCKINFLGKLLYHFPLLHLFRIFKK